MSATPDFTILDPLAEYLAEHTPQGNIFHLPTVYDALVEAGHDFTYKQVECSAAYLRRSYSLVEWPEDFFGRRHGRCNDGWMRWVGSAELYAERRRRAGNYLLGSARGLAWDDPERVAHREERELVPA